MRRLRIIHQLRTLLAIVIVVGSAGLVGTIGWLNQSGLPASWREGIALALAKQGVHADIATLRWVPFRGFEAGSVTVFADDSHDRIIARLQRLVFDLDRTKLARGEFKIERLDLSGARISLLVDPLDPRSRSLDLRNLTGRIEFSGKRSVHISRASGMVGGIQIDLDCLIDLYRPGHVTTPSDMEKARAERRQLLLQVIEGLDALKLRSSLAPRIRLEIRGDLENPDSLRAQVGIHARDLQSRDLLIQQLDARGELHGHTLVVHQMDILAGDGSLNGQGEYDLHQRAGRFSLRSSLPIVDLLTDLSLPLPEDMPSFEGAPQLEARGEFQHDGSEWSFRLIGHAQVLGPRFRHFHADRLECSFSSDGRRLLLDDLEVDQGDGSFRGRAFIEPGRIRYEGESTLPLSWVQEMVTIQPLRTILGDFSPGDGFRSHMRFRGHANPHDHFDWGFQATAEAHHIRYRGVPAAHAKVDMDLKHGTLDFSSGEVTFDYQDYPLRRRYSGPQRGQVQVDRILYDHPSRTVTITDLRATAWPAPILRCFAPPIADHLETYAFHRPPTLTASGIIGVTPKHPQQDLRVDFSTPDPVNYPFLGKDVTFDRASGSVRVLTDRVRIDQLELDVFDGSVRADLVQTPGKPDLMAGSIDWTTLDLKSIAETYRFKSKPPGIITGRIDFELKGQEITGFGGQGHIALENAQLFDVPMFGPLSPVLATVLTRKKAGFQEANAAFCSFDIEDGVVRTQDFITTTPSLVFTGDGQADLGKLTLDMTIRMNARGLLGVITLPLRPFYGLFQFNGTGPIENPEWKNVMFTSPPDDQKARLLDPPRARAVDNSEPSPSETPPRALPVRD
ncbi:MAG: hypothetical protein MUF31_02340 [Akkermansiaceae bacterium]|nr:hypothetical protein [Akkermansiaceae bacterium]